MTMHGRDGEWGPKRGDDLTDSENASILRYARPPRRAVDVTRHHLAQGTVCIRMSVSVAGVNSH